MRVRMPPLPASWATMVCCSMICGGQPSAIWFCDGVPETVAMKISGHKTREVFDRYNISSNQDIAEAAQKYDRRRKLANDKKYNKSGFRID